MDFHIKHHIIGGQNVTPCTWTRDFAWTVLGLGNIWAEIWTYETHKRVPLPPYFFLK